MHLLYDIGCTTEYIIYNGGWLGGLKAEEIEKHYSYAYKIDTTGTVGTEIPRITTFTQISNNPYFFHNTVTKQNDIYIIRSQEKNTKLNRDSNHRPSPVLYHLSYPGSHASSCSNLPLETDATLARRCGHETICH